MVYNEAKAVSEMLKKLLFVAVCVVTLMVLARSGVLDSLKPKPMSFDRIAEQFKKDGLTVTDRRPISSRRSGVAKGESMKVNGMRVEVSRYENSARLSIDYENYKPGAGDAVAQRMGIITQLGVQSRPTRGPQSYPAKKGSYLIIVYSTDRATARRITDSFSRL
jgi:hypothetical protein